jgi:hypothetical protein
MKATAVLKILETPDSVVYRRPLDRSACVVLDATELQLVYLKTDGEVAERRTLWKLFKRDMKNAWASGEFSEFNRLTEGRFTAFLSLYWGTLYRQRNWEVTAPSLGEVVRTLVTYCEGAGYRLFTLPKDAPLLAAAPYAVEIEDMHYASDYDS